MSIERVKTYLEEFNLSERIREFDVSSATVELAAQALDCEPGRIAKTLAFKSNDSAVLIVAAGNGRIDNSKFKNTFGIKAKMLSPDEVKYFTGHTVGGVCPFALTTDIKVYLDSSLKKYETVFPACGNSSSAIELSIAELEKCSAAVGWIDVCKNV